MSRPEGEGGLVRPDQVLLGVFWHQGPEARRRRQGILGASGRLQLAVEEARKVLNTTLWVTDFAGMTHIVTMTRLKLAKRVFS